MPSQTTQILIDRITERDRQGAVTYGKTLDRGDLTPEEWADHLIDELTDGAGYAQAFKRVVAELRAKNERLEQQLRAARSRLARAYAYSIADAIDYYEDKIAGGADPAEHDLAILRAQFEQLAERLAGKKAPGAADRAHRLSPETRRAIERATDELDELRAPSSS